MKIKIGDTVYDAEDQPVAIILTDQDKKNITNMDSKCSMYACFPDGWGTEKEMYEWMGASGP